MLIVQAKNQKPKGVDKPRLTVTFINPIDEVFEMGLLNIQNDVTIHITDLLALSYCFT
jgi:hypothetical protein